MNILTPITMSPALAFLPRFRWQPQEDAAREHCRAALAELTRLAAERYACEQMASANSGTDQINRHWRNA